MKSYFIIIVGFMFISTQLAAKNPGTNSIGSGWFAGVDAGVNVVVAEDFQPYFPQSAIKGTGATSRIVAGYQFSQVFSMRGLAGVANSNWYNRKNSNSFHSEYCAVDFRIHLLNIITDFSPNQKSDFLIFAGGGMLNRNKITPSIRANDDISILLPIVRLGMGYDYLLTRKLKLNLNAELNFTGDKLNGYDAGIRSFDILSCLTIGMVYHLSPEMKGRWNY